MDKLSATNVGTLKRWSTKSFRAAMALVLIPLALFMAIKATLNTDVLGTDTVIPVDATQLQLGGSKLVYVPPFKVFGDLSDGMYPAGKVYEDGLRLLPASDWFGDVQESGRGRTFYMDHHVFFSTSDNSSPASNGRSYAVGYNPMAWLNVDWLSMALLVLLWGGLGLLKKNDTARTLRNSPNAWLALFLLDRFITIVSSPNFSLSLVPDSPSYTYLASHLHSLEKLLSAARTPGYPAFYAMVPDALIPAVQLALFFGAIYIFFLGLRAISNNGWVPLLACLPLAMINGTYRLDAIVYAYLLIPDSLALSMGLYAIGSCLLLLGDSRRRRWWMLLCGLTVLYAYQLKPSYLFLVVCIPALTLGWLALCRRNKWRETLRGVCLPVILIVTIPLIAFCGLRWGVVGQFNLTSYGGWQSIGLAGNFLDKATANQMPEDLRPFARDVAKIVQEKKALAPKYLKGEQLYRHIFRTCDWILYGNGELGRFCRNAECYTRLGHLSQKVLTLHLGRYWDWLETATIQSWIRVILLGRWHGIVLWGLGASFAFFVIAWLRSAKTAGLWPGLRKQLLRCDVKMLCWTFACLFSASLAVIILVTIPYSRYLLPTRILFLPLCLYMVGALIRGGIQLWRAPEHVNSAR